MTDPRRPVSDPDSIQPDTVPGNYRYIYRCAQDSKHALASRSKGQRLRERTVRFPCNSKLNFRPCLETRTLNLLLHHEYHDIYEDYHLAGEVLDFVRSKITTQTPAEIFRALRDCKIPGAEDVIQSQVYYQWQTANKTRWQRDQDPLVSAKILLDESEHLFEEYTYANMTGIAVFVKSSIEILAQETKELAMDATFGTNSAGMDLFTVLAEYDGTGIPIAYMLIDKSNDGKERVPDQAGALTFVLQRFLVSLRDKGLHPAFFGTDKDRSEINAILHAWPSICVQLCLWHLKRAIRQKMKSSAFTKTLQHYRPEEAARVVRNLELCWGCTSHRRTHGKHRSRQCDCPSRNENFPESGRCETRSPQEREIVLDMISRHYNAHPLFIDCNKTHKTSRQIWEDSASEMYQWCRSRDYFHLWAYLWVNWYAPEQWPLWARSSNPVENPVLKTTMIVESHWRKLKQDYLHRFNRPRIDLVLYLLLDRVIPDSISRLAAMQRQCRRQGVASWRKDWKATHRQLLSLPPP